ncbi:glycosyltransferase family 2 protein [Fibrobacter sp.]
MPQISVIVAVYAAEKYMRRCLDSLLCQTFRNFEVILVDDGSKDQSGKICDEYAKKDSRVRVIHKENGGVASARQCGLDNATGDYVIHVDPDDWVEPTMLEEMLQNAIENSSDMVICDFIRHEDKKSHYFSQKPKSLESQNVMRELFQGLHGACWNKLVRRSLFKEFNISFPPKMVVWEDLFVSIHLAIHDIRISYIPKAFYHYDSSVNENSLVNELSDRKLQSMLFFIDYFDSIEGFDKSLLNRGKIDIKRFVFMKPGLKKKDFVAICSDINDLFLAGFEGFKKLDSLIRFSLIHPWPIARFALWAWQTKRSFLRAV